LLPLPAEMLGIVSSTPNNWLVVKPGEPLCQHFPDAVEASGLSWKRTTSVLSFEQEPLVGNPWAIGRRHIPNPVDIIPSNRFSRSFRVLAGNLVFGHHQPIVADHARKSNGVSKFGWELFIDIDSPGHPFDVGWASADSRIAARLEKQR
jgi:hypothetical protein